MAGWHLHFISEDRGRGGHVLDCRAETAHVQLDPSASCTSSCRRGSTSPIRMPRGAPTPRSIGSSTVADAPQRVLVTGAAGFIGRALVDRFRELGSEVRGVDVIETGDEAHLVADLTAPGDWQAPRRGLRPGRAHGGGGRDVQLASGLLGDERRRGAARTGRGNRGRREAVRPPLLDRRLRLRLRGRGRRALPGAPQRRALRRHEDRQRAGRARGPCRGRDPVHDRPAGRRLRAGLAAVDDRADPRC